MHAIDTTGHEMPQSVAHAMPSVAAAARQNLQELVDGGIRRSSAVIERILGECPTDYLVRSDRLGFTIGADAALTLGFSVAADGGRSEATHSLTAHDHAFAQIVERAGVPLSYARGLTVRDVTGTPKADLSLGATDVLTDNSWRRTLIQHTLAQHFKHGPQRRNLVRTFNGQARGFLSDRFRRLDSRPLFEAFAAACQDVGAVPVEGLANDVRVTVRAILPHVVEPVPGEAMVWGLAWTNSDYGAGTYSISTFAKRLICLNGMVGENAMRNVHLGGRLPDELVFSDETYRKDTEVTALATRDVVRALLDPAMVDRKADAIRRAHATGSTFAAGFAQVRNLLTKDETAQVKSAFEGPDTVMLPAGQTAWRFANALSWVANTSEPARKAELQEAAGRVLSTVAA